MMNNRTLATFATIICLCVLGLFASRYFGTLTINNSTVPAKYLNANDIQGIAVLYNNKEWTLNFEQQNQFIELVNKMVIVEKEMYKGENEALPFEKITIYSFKSKPFDIIPVGIFGNKGSELLGLTSNDLVFNAPTLTDKGYLRDFSTGNLKALIESTYDKIE